jgi:hypothetical protein
MACSNNLQCRFKKLSTKYGGSVSDTDELLQTGPAEQDPVTHTLSEGSCRTESSGAD